MTVLRLNLGKRGYEINIGCDLLSHIDEYFNLNRKAFIVTDEGVPSEYARAVSERCREAKIVTVPMGEGSKSLDTYSRLLYEMAEFGLTRTDCAVAVGGGVVGDLVGFLAATYMRGIDFYNVPTTLLSQVDSSIGGKTAINLGGIKNTVGAFHQPRGVLIDTNTLKTLDKRHFRNGLAEAIKMSLTSNKELFSLFENEEINEENIEKIIVEALKIKKAVVEADEREVGLRKILNFGHTLGHGIESAEGMGGLYHGECVALGMLVTSSKEARARLIAVLQRVGLPYRYEGDIEAAISYISHDKKCDGDSIDAVFVERVGECETRRISLSEFATLVRASDLKNA